tara:strand:+ start:1901 stop:2119 length:219 start_codon:yes stop_codon:yes gene_type:complete
MGGLLPLSSLYYVIPLGFIIFLMKGYIMRMKEAILEQAEIEAVDHYQREFGELNRYEQDECIRIAENKLLGI